MLDRIIAIATGNILPIVPGNFVKKFSNSNIMLINIQANPMYVAWEKMILYLLLFLQRVNANKVVRNIIKLVIKKKFFMV